MIWMGGGSRFPQEGASCRHAPRAGSVPVARPRLCEIVQFLCCCYVGRPRLEADRTGPDRGGAGRGRDEGEESPAVSDGTAGPRQIDIYSLISVHPSLCRLTISAIAPGTTVTPLASWALVMCMAFMV